VHARGEQQRKVIGVMQTLNKKNGIFTDEDERACAPSRRRSRSTLEKRQAVDDVTR